MKKPGLNPLALVLLVVLLVGGMVAINYFGSRNAAINAPSDDHE